VKKAILPAGKLSKNTKIIEELETIFSRFISVNKTSINVKG